MNIDQARSATSEAVHSCTNILALAAAACGADDGCGGGAASPDDGGKVVIGIKFDQPGLGLKEGDNYTGFDVEVAQVRGQGARLHRRRVQGVAVGPARDAAPERPGRR